MDEELVSPILSLDPNGYVIKLPVPISAKDGFRILHGLYFDDDEESYGSLWRLFKASLFHTSLHAAYSDFKTYAPWARNKNLTTATFCVTLIEDLRVTLKAFAKWRGTLRDIAYANYVSSLRVNSIGKVSSKPLVFATELLLETWGVNAGGNRSAEETTTISNLASKTRALVTQAIERERTEGMQPLFEAADATYDAISRLGMLDEIPCMPYADSRGTCSVFDNKILEQEEKDGSLLESAHRALGLDVDKDYQQSVNASAEAKEFYHEIELTEGNRSEIRARYEPIIASTNLDSVGFPKGDYGMFLRTRSSLSGALRSIRDQLRIYHNMLDETSGHESGHIDTQMAMQVLASGNIRNDVFQREEIVRKDEAWAILIDTSRSISYFAQEARGVAVCLAEVAKDLIPSQNQWGVFAFNKSLYVIKDFDEPYSMESRARIGGLTQKNSTLLPDAILSCHATLAAVPIENKIMMVVSDGYPVGYPEIEKSLALAIQKVSRSGIFLIGVGISNPEISEHFKVSCVLKNPYQLMKFFVKTYAELSSLF